MFGQEGPAEAYTATLTADARAEQLTKQIEHRIIDWLSRRAGLTRDALHRDTEFAALGIDSIAIVELVTEIEKTVGKKLPDSSAFEYPSVGELAAFTSGFVIHGEPRKSSPDVRADASASFVAPRFAIRS